MNLNLKQSKMLHNTTEDNLEDLPAGFLLNCPDDVFIQIVNSENKYICRCGLSSFKKIQERIKKLQDGEGKKN